MFFTTDKAFNEVRKNGGNHIPVESVQVTNKTWYTMCGEIIFIVDWPNLTETLNLNGKWGFTLNDRFTPSELKRFFPEANQTVVDYFWIGDE